MISREKRFYVAFAVGTVMSLLPWALLGSDPHSDPHDHSLLSSSYLITMGISFGCSFPLFIEAMLDYYDNVNRDDILERVLTIIFLLVPAGFFLHSNCSFSFLVVFNWTTFTTVLAALSLLVKTGHAASSTLLMFEIFFYMEWICSLVPYYVHTGSSAVSYVNFVAIALVVILGCSYCVVNYPEIEKFSIVNFKSFTYTRESCIAMVLSLSCFFLLTSAFVMNSLLEEPTDTRQFVWVLEYVFVIRVVCGVAIVIIPGRLSRHSLSSAQVALATKRNFVRYISHEMRSPLNVIAMDIENMKEMLQQGVTVSKKEIIDTEILRSSSMLKAQKEYNIKKSTSEMNSCINEIEDACEHAGVILADLLVYENMEEDANIELKKGLISAVTFIQEVVQDVLQMHGCLFKLNTQHFVSRDRTFGTVAANTIVLNTGNCSPEDCLLIDYEKCKNVFKTLLGNMLQYYRTNIRGNKQAGIVIFMNRSEVKPSYKRDKKLVDSLQALPLGIVSFDLEMLVFPYDDAESSVNSLSHVACMKPAVVTAPLVDEHLQALQAGQAGGLRRERSSHRGHSTRDFDSLSNHSISSKSSNLGFESFNPNELHGGGMSSVMIWICKKTIHMHGGSVDLLSAGALQGTGVVHVTLPLYCLLEDISSSTRRSHKGVPLFGWKLAKSFLRGYEENRKQIACSSDNSEVDFESVVDLEASTPNDFAADVSPVSPVTEQEPLKEDSLVSELSNTIGVTHQCLGKESFSQHSKRKLCFLVVDDSAMNRKVVSRLLAAMGFDYKEAWDGVEAVQMMNQSLINPYDGRPQYDVVLLDNVMTHLHGPATAKQMREMGFAGAIIGVTGNTLPADVEDFLAHGANKVLFKPLKKAILVAALMGYVPPGTLFET